MTNAIREIANQARPISAWLWDGFSFLVLIMSIIVLFGYCMNVDPNLTNSEKEFSKHLIRGWPMLSKGGMPLPDAICFLLLSLAQLFKQPRCKKNCDNCQNYKRQE